MPDQKYTNKMKSLSKFVGPKGSFFKVTKPDIIIKKKQSVQSSEIRGEEENDIAPFLKKTLGQSVIPKVSVRQGVLSNNLFPCIKKSKHNNILKKKNC